MKIAFLFPGQGSQHVGMAKDIFEKYPAVQKIYNTVSELCRIDIAKLLFVGPASELKKSENAQIAILTMSLAIYQILTEAGINPLLMAGHSLGEYSALISAGAMNIKTGVKIVRKRGQLMAQACSDKPGAMAAINKISINKLENICKKVRDSDYVEISNYNSPEQYVISGTRQGVEAVALLAKTNGSKVIFLPVSGAFHSILMKEASDKFSEAIKNIDIRKAVCPIIGNVNASVLQSPSDIAEEMQKHMLSPVKWTESIQKMLNMGICTFIEVGPGHVLKGLILRIDRKAEVYTSRNVRELEFLFRKLV
jgi:[acyl-carrier-protein] S-malonyltransferase